MTTMVPVSATLSGRIIPLSSSIHIRQCFESLTSFSQHVWIPSLQVPVTSLSASASENLPNLSIRHYHMPKSNSTSSSIPSLTTYSAWRNKVTMRSQRGEGKYVSPYSDFFANIEAGRTSLGTTEDMERKAFEIKEQYLDCGIPESALRFRTVSYGRFALPPYVSPGEHRVTVKVPLSSIPFKNAAEREVFLKIVGSRYNADNDELQLSSEKFASRIENKRLLVGMIEQIVSNSVRLAREFQEEDEQQGQSVTSGTV